MSITPMPIGITRLRTGRRECFDETRWGYPVPVSRARDAGGGALIDTDLLLEIAAGVVFAPEAIIDDDRKRMRSLAPRRVKMAKKAGLQVQVRRVYDAKKRSDGTRVLVDRIWPRGLTKADADLDEWCKEVAPSTQLRKWYGHDPQKFNEFVRRYHAELKQPERADALAHLRELATKRTLTLLTATKAPEISEAEVLAEMLRD